MSDETDHHLELAAQIVSAYVAHNRLPPNELLALISSTSAALSNLIAAPPVELAKLSPAVPVKKSITPDFLICLEDGKKFKTLRRHLNATYGLTPEQYREKWGLSSDYPMVAPNYAEARSQLAKTRGLGRPLRKR